MKKLSGFSLMEMMIVLLIVSIIAGATAPMINKKLVTAASEKSPWVWIGQNTSNGISNIGYNLLGGNLTATIGTTEIKGNIKPRLYIDSDKRHPNIGLKYKDNSIAWNIATSGSSFSITSYDTSNTDTQYSANTNITEAIAIGGNANSSGTTAVGYSATASGERSIALGNGTSATGTNAISIAGMSDDNQASQASGDHSIAIGANTHALISNSIAIGVDSVAGISNSTTTDTSSTIAIGCGANAESSDSIAIGHGSTTNSDNSIVIGHGAMANNNNDNAIAIGHNTQATVKRSIAIGEQAFAHGENSIAIGATDADDTSIHWYPEASGKNSIAIGTRAKAEHENSVAIGAGAVTTASNQIALGDANTTVYIPGNLVVRGTVAMMARLESGQAAMKTIWSGDLNNFSPVYWSYSNYTYPSDRRLKNVGKAFKGGLEDIKKLEVFNYTFKKDKSKTPRVGVMAQDLEKIFPSAVTKGEDGFLRIRMEEMFYALVNAVKELDTKFDLLAQKQKKIDELEDKVSKLEKRLVELEKKIK